MNKKGNLYEGTVTLGLGHSLIYNNAQEVVPISQLENFEQAYQSFGLYGMMTDDSISQLESTTGNSNGDTDENFIYPIFRGLSQTIVRKKWDPIDFTKKGVLENSLDLLVGQTVYTDHYAYVGNQVGVIIKAFWDKGYTTDGVKVPPGINIQLKIDAKNNKKLADSLTMDPPALHSNSVTVGFTWEQSHPNLSFDDFRSKVGQFDDKGELIRRVATSIKAYTETSIVSHGADPYAKIVGADGKIQNPRIAQSMDSFSYEGPSKTSFHFMSFKDKESFGLPTIPNEPDNTNIDETTKKLKMKKEHLLLLATLAGYSISEEVQGLDEEEFSAQFDMEAFEAHLLENPVDAQAMLSAQAELEAAQAEIDKLKTENASLKEATPPAPAVSFDQEEFELIRTERIEEISRVYSLIKGEEPTDSLKANWNKSNLSSLKVLEETYKEQLEAKFPAKCSNCGSTSLTRATSTPETPEGRSSSEVEQFSMENPIDIVNFVKSTSK